MSATRPEVDVSRRAEFEGIGRALKQFGLAVNFLACGALG
jgi:hypothetical protein